MEEYNRELIEKFRLTFRGQIQMVVGISKLEPFVF